jgi:hypothetical protein
VAGNVAGVLPTVAGNVAGVLPTVAGNVAGVLPTVAGTAAPVAAPPVDGLPSFAVPGTAATTVPVPAPVDAASPAAAPTVPLAPVADPLPGFTVVVAAPETPAPAVAPDADEVPATVAPADLPAVAAAAPGEGAAPDTGSAPDQDTPPPAPAAAAPATAAVAGPAVPAVAPVAVAEPAAPAAPAPPVSGQVAQQVAVLRTAPDGTHTMTVVLTPETLGPVEVQVTLTQGSVELTLKSATEAGRSALLEALPDLRRDLAGAGLTCTNASVDRDPGGSWASAQQHAAGDRAGQHGQPDGRGRPWLRGTDVDAGRSASVPSTAIPSSGLDVRV